MRIHREPEASGATRRSATIPQDGCAQCWLEVGRGVRAIECRSVATELPLPAREWSESPRNAVPDGIESACITGPFVPTGFGSKVSGEVDQACR